MCVLRTIKLGRAPHPPAAQVGEGAQDVDDQGEGCCVQGEALPLRAL